MTTSGAELLARIKPKRAEAKATICLRPDLLNEWARLDEELSSLRETARPSTMSTVKAASRAEREAAKRVQEVEAHIEDSQVEFTFRAMPNADYQALVDQHPPRKGNQLDAIAGHNRAAVEDAGIRACLVDPVFEDCLDSDCDHVECGSWQQLLGVCNPSEWAELRRAFGEANGSVTSAPKSRLASLILRSGDAD